MAGQLELLHMQHQQQEVAGLGKAVEQSWRLV